MKKKMISLLLVLALYMGLMVPTFAQNENEVRVVDLGHGEYAMANWFSRSSDTYHAESVDLGGGIYYIEDINQLLMKVGDDHFLATEQKALKISEAEQIDMLNVPEEVKETIRQDFELNGKVEGVLYGPDVANVMNTYPEERHYTYNGYQMSQYIYSKKDSSGYVDVARGVNAGKIAQATLNLAVTVAGVEFTKVGIAASGVSLLADFLQAFGYPSVATGKGGDYVQINAAWTRYDKFTYVFDPGINDTRLGAITERVILNQVFSCHYYQALGMITHEEVTGRSGQLIVSPHYSAPDKEAISHVMEPLIENDMVGIVQSARIMF